MYEYQFVSVDLKLGIFNRGPKEDFQKIINTYALAGWRLVQIFTPSWVQVGARRYVQLIFEKAKEPTATGSEAPC